MVGRISVLTFLLLTATSSVWAQLVSTATELKVRVLYVNDRPAPRQLRVELVTPSELFVAMAFTDDQGQVEFSTRPGTYRLRVTGIEIEDTTSTVFSVYSGEHTHFETVRVQLKKSGNQHPISDSHMVHAPDLIVPPKAKREYDGAGRAMQEGDWARARQKLEKAIRLHPEYAAAHNDLGVVHMNTGHKEEGRVAFARAIAVNPQYGRAYRNLALLTFSEGKNAEASVLLKKALSSDPLDPQALTLMAQLQLLDGETEDALANARKVHSVPHEGQAVAHFIAARALEARNLNDEAAAEYRMFLKEAPNSASAPKARAALEKLATKVN